jgi:hypothetical protein
MDEKEDPAFSCAIGGELQDHSLLVHRYHTDHITVLLPLQLNYIRERRSGD